MLDPVQTTPPAVETVTDQERLNGALAHALAFSGFIVPFGQLLGPLLVMLLEKRPGSAFVLGHAKESLNFQLTWLLPVLFFGLLSFVLIGIPFLVAIVLFQSVMAVIATVKANSGEAYRYPASIRFIR